MTMQPRAPPALFPALASLPRWENSASPCRLPDPYPLCTPGPPDHKHPPSLLPFLTIFVLCASTLLMAYYSTSESWHHLGLSQSPRPRGSLSPCITLLPCRLQTHWVAGRKRLGQGLGEIVSGPLSTLSFFSSNSEPSDCSIVVASG